MITAEYIEARIKRMEAEGRSEQEIIEEARRLLVEWNKETRAKLLGVKAVQEAVK